jgi:hypothetical protein
MFSWQSFSRGDCFVPRNDENKDKIASCLAMTTEGNLDAGQIRKEKTEISFSILFFSALHLLALL